MPLSAQPAMLLAAGWEDVPLTDICPKGKGGRPAADKVLCRWGDSVIGHSQLGTTASACLFIRGTRQKRSNNSTCPGGDQGLKPYAEVMAVK